MTDEEELSDDFENDDDDGEEPEQILLQVKDGKASIKKEPFATIEIENEKDFISIKLAVDIKKHIMDCSNCAGLGWSNCKYFRQNLDQRKPSSETKHRSGKTINKEIKDGKRSV